MLGAQQRIDAALERKGLSARYAGGCASFRPLVPALTYPGACSPP